MKLVVFASQAITDYSNRLVQLIDIADQAKDYVSLSTHVIRWSNKLLKSGKENIT